MSCWKLLSRIVVQIKSRQLWWDNHDNGMSCWFWPRVPRMHNSHFSTALRSVCGIASGYGRFRWEKLIGKIIACASFPSQVRWHCSARSSMYVAPRVFESLNCVFLYRLFLWRLGRSSCRPEDCLRITLICDVVARAHEKKAFIARYVPPLPLFHPLSVFCTLLSFCLKIEAKKKKNICKLSICKQNQLTVPLPRLKQFSPHPRWDESACAWTRIWTAAHTCDGSLRAVSLVQTTGQDKTL